MKLIKTTIALLLVFSVLFSGLLRAQSSGRAIYGVYTLGGVERYRAILDFSPERSLYRGETYTGETRAKVEKEVVKREGDKIEIKTNATTHDDDVCVAMDVAKNEIESYAWLMHLQDLREYRTYEPMREINWELVDSTKQFGRFTAQGARCAFRGREYMVWYVPEIPVSFGPWKFNGLPGLIVEASERDGGSFRFVLKELDVKEGHQVPEAVFPKNAKRTPIAEYAYYHDNRAAAILDLLKARAPRGEKFNAQVTSDGEEGVETDVERNFKDLNPQRLEADEQGN